VEEGWGELTLASFVVKAESRLSCLSTGDRASGVCDGSVCWGQGCSCDGLRDVFAAKERWAALLGLS